MKQMAKLAYLYSALSVLIGPLIASIGFRHPSGGDCGDSTWGNAPVADRQALYQEAQTLMLIAASVMLLIGLVLLGTLLYKALKQKALKQALLPALVVLGMLAGYGLIVLVAKSSWC